MSVLFEAFAGAGVTGSVGSLVGADNSEGGRGLGAGAGIGSGGFCSTFGSGGGVGATGDGFCSAGGTTTTPDASLREASGSGVVVGAVTLGANTGTMLCGAPLPCRRVASLVKVRTICGENGFISSGASAIEVIITH